MYNYKCFKIKSKIKGDLSPKEIFSLWLLQAKSACHKWRVLQNIRRALPLTCHIELGLDYTELQYADDQAAKPVDLPYYPSVEQIFGELSRQSRTITPIPSLAKEIQVDLLLPLKDDEKFEQDEAELQIQSFIAEVQTPMPTLEKKTAEVDTSSDLTEEDMNVLLKGLEELDFDHPIIQKKVLQQTFQIWSDAQPTQTRAKKRKRSDLPTSGPEREATIQQARQEISDAFREATQATTSSSKKSKNVRFDILKPSKTSLQEPKVIDDSPDVSPT